MGQFGAAVSTMDVLAMKCEMCFPLECQQSAKVRTAVVWEACKRKSQCSACPRSFQLCSTVFSAIHDAYHGFGSAITAYSYTDRQPIARKYDIFSD